MTTDPAVRSRLQAENATAMQYAQKMGVADQVRAQPATMAQGNARDGADAARAAADKAEAEHERREEQARLARQQQQAAELARKQAQEKAEADRIARETERKRQEEQRKLAAEQARRQAEQDLRGRFSGRATTCIGGGKDVLYLQASTPPRSGCNVSFEARCPGTLAGAGVRFSQNNYVGGSCQGLGDIIRIGTMGCAAEQVQVSMTGASCG